MQNGEEKNGEENGGERRRTKPCELWNRPFSTSWAKWQDKTKPDHSLLYSLDILLYSIDLIPSAESTSSLFLVKTVELNLTSSTPVRSLSWHPLTCKSTVYFGRKVESLELHVDSLLLPKITCLRIFVA